MNDGNNQAFVYHALLIGIDAYPIKSLHGCVNDIDDIEAMLRAGLNSPGIDLRIKRLAAPGADSGLAAVPPADLPTRVNILRELRALADPAVVSSGDRVLVYYSGHGDQQTWPSQVVHEALVTTDGRFIFDVEINPLVNAISSQGADVTFVLDCCHSGGASRGLPGGDGDGEVAMRYYDSGLDPVSPPDDLAVPVDGDVDTRDAGSGLTRLLQGADPSYVVVAACQADELAAERNTGGRYNGLLTRGFATIIRNQAAGRLANLRWADIWGVLLDQVSGAGDQHPWLIGRSERKVFGGPWEPHDPGFSVKGPDSNGSYTIGAGSLMGLTEGGVLAVYGETPPMFPPLRKEDGTEDTTGQVGRLRVEKDPGRSSCTARSTGAEFDLPQGARARLVEPGQSEWLLVGLENTEDAVVAELESAPPLLKTVPAGSADVEVLVRGSAQQGWVIGNKVEPDMASVGAGDTGGLRLGLEAYSRYNAALRLAKRSADPALKGMLAVRLLDVRDNSALLQATAGQLDGLIAALAEAPRRGGQSPVTNRPYGGNYVLPKGFKFAVEVTNNYTTTLYLTLLDCTAGGKVQYLTDETVKPNKRVVLWANGMQGNGWGASPSMGRQEATDQFIVVATTRPGVDLTYLRQDRNIQSFLDERTRDVDEEKSLSAGPSELWTAVTLPVIMVAAG